MSTTMNNKASRPAYRGDGVRELIRTYDRAPFQDVLSDLLDVMPTKQQLQAFALRNPEKYIAAIATIARLSGYSEKNEVVHRHFIEDVREMSDVELEQRLLEKTRLLSDQRRDGSGSPDASTSDVSDQRTKSPDLEVEALVIDGEWEEDQGPESQSAMYPILRRVSS